MQSLITRSGQDYEQLIFPETKLEQPKSSGLTGQKGKTTYMHNLTVVMELTIRSGNPQCNTTSLKETQTTSAASSFPRNVVQDTVPARMEY